MNKSVSEFLNGVCSFVRCEAVHEDIKEELMLHIDEKAEELISEGADEESAYKKAVSSMGNPAEIGESLDKKHRPQAEWSLILLTAVISFFGIIIVYLSSSSDAYIINPYRYSVFTALGIIGAITACFFNYVKLKDKPHYIFIAGVVLLVFCAFFGISVAGVKRYINLGGFVLNVNHASTIFFVTAFAGFMTKYKDEGFFGIAKLGGWGICSLVLFLIQPSVSSVLITGSAYLILMLAAIGRGHFGGRRGIQAFATLSAVLLAAVSAILSVIIKSPSRIERLLFVFDKGASDPYGGGWVYSIADKVLKASQFIGKGEPLQQGNIDVLLPGITSDFALINIIHNFGWLAGIMLILVIGIYLIRLFTVTRKIKNPFGFYLSLGAASLLAIQFVINILYNLGFFPITDITMPFVSYGGSGYLACMICVGTVLSVWRRNNILPLKTESKRKKRKIIILEENRLIINFGREE